MRTPLSASFGLALAVSAFAFSTAPASAIETHAVAAVPAVFSGVTKASGRCMLWQHRCRELYPAGGWRFRRCKALHGCG